MIYFSCELSTVRKLINRFQIQPQQRQEYRPIQAIFIQNNAQKFENRPIWRAIIFTLSLLFVTLIIND